MFMNKLLILLDMPKILEFGSFNFFFLTMKFKIVNN